MKSLPAFNRLFDDIFDNSVFGLDTRSVMKTDVIETDNEYRFDIELPGYKKEDIQVEYNEGYLTISASKNDDIEEKDKKGNIIRKERYCGSCSRRFYVGNINKDDIKAKYSNGELKISLPKSQEAKSEIHRIEIK